MAITTEQIDRAVQLFVRHVYRIPRKAADCDTTELAAEVQNMDDWYEATSGAEATSRKVSLNNALSASFRAKTSGAERALLNSAYAAALAGL